MEQDLATHPAYVDQEPAPQPARVRNHLAHVSSWIGLAGVVLVAGVVALGYNAYNIASSTPDFMPDDITDDPFILTCVACVVPIFVGVIGFWFAIVGLALARTHGQRGVALRGLLLAIFTVLASIAVGVVMINFEALTAACGGG